MKKVFKISIVFMFVFLGWVGGCGEYETRGLYCCVYQERHTDCDGNNWTEWQDEDFGFNVDDYIVKVPDIVCQAYRTGTVHECDGSCCIDSEYRDTALRQGSCES